MVALLPSLLVLIAVATGPMSPVRQLLESNVADSLVVPLVRFENAHRGSEAAEAAFALGELHYARGEYRQAADAFARAAARFDPTQKGEARYWAGLAWLGSGEVSQARAAFEEAAKQVTPPPPEALLGVALCWELAQRPDRATETLQTLLADDPGEAGPAALEHLAVLAQRLERPEQARRARDQLVREYPRSLEAARAGQATAAQPRTAPPAARRLAPAPPLAPGHLALPPVVAQGPFTVQIGAFRDAALAQQLAGQARRQGFTPVRVSALRDASGALYPVRVGVYATAEDARGAGIRLGRALGVTWRVVPAP